MNKLFFWKDYLKTFARFLLANSLPKSLFRNDINIATARYLFSKYVKLVEIENHSFCNRNCWFCPNSIYERNTMVRINPDVYKKILSELASINYDQTLVWARYHEPLADESIYNNLKLARQKLPHAFLTLHTNGDYLDTKVIDKLEKIGLDQLRINMYIQNGKAYTKKNVNSILTDLKKRTNLNIIKKSLKYGGLQLEGSKIHMILNIPNFKKKMSSRGGILTREARLINYERYSICFSPIQHVVIDYNGFGVLCCQVRSDIPNHKKAIIGDLNYPNYSIFHLYRDLAIMRKHLLSFGIKKGVCRRCNVSCDSYKIARLYHFSKFVSMIPGLNNASSKLVGFSFIGFGRRRYEQKAKNEKAS